VLRPTVCSSTDNCQCRLCISQHASHVTVWTWCTCTLSITLTI
jgi:hypothetical protein